MPGKLVPGQGWLTEALVQLGFALLSRACQTWNRCFQMFTLQVKLVDAHCPEAPQQRRVLHLGEETPENGSVTGKRWDDLLLKSFSISAFAGSVGVRVTFSEMKAVGAG